MAALLGGHRTVRRLVDRALADSKSTSAAPEPTIDWRAMLASNTRAGELTWEWEGTGPDHDIHFAVKIEDARGRSAEGSGRSKKAANHEAAAAFIRRWMPHVMPTLTTEAKPPSVVAR